MDAEPTGRAQPKRPQDELAVSAFLLALFVMILPLEADMLDPLVRRGRVLHAAVFAAGCFLAVFLPFLACLRRRRREPNARRGRGYVVATAVILVLNLLFVGGLLVSTMLIPARAPTP